MFSSNTTQVSAGSYQISRSLRFDSAAPAYLDRTPASASNRKTWTWSGWVKRGRITSGQAQNLFAAGSSPATGFHFINATDILQLYDYSGVYNFKLETTQVYRDPSAWYHFVVAFDTTQATASDRLKLYVNGIQVTSFSTATYPTQNTDYQINNNVITYIGRTGIGPIYDFDGYQTEINFIDGQQLTPSSFGETNAQTGVWQPKAFSGTYGTNGFYVNFSDNSNTTASTLGKDYSGNGNNFTPNNFSVSAGAGNDSMVDVPTPYGVDTGVGGTVRGNYCTLNPLYVNGAGTPAYTNGNLDMLAGGSGDSYFGGTFAISSGKWYYECLINAVGTGGTSILIGICKTSAPNGVNIGSYRSTSEIYNLDGTAQTAGATYAAGDTIGVAIDIDAGTVKFYKNNTGQGATPSFTFTAGTEVFVRGRSDSSNPSATFNFGQRAFTYTAPSGFKALCTQNLPTPTIGATSTTLAEDYFTTLLWTSTGAVQTVTGADFQPDLVWVKSRTSSSANEGYHHLVDAVRGTVSGVLSTNVTSAEYWASTNYSVTAFNSNGFSSGIYDGFNGNPMVTWLWKANGSGSTNTAGSITSTVSASTTSGFSIVAYTGNAVDNATIGHGLGVAPSLLICKSRNAVGAWPTWVTAAGFGANDFLALNSTDGKGTAVTLWGGSNGSVPTSTVFKVGNNGNINGSGTTYIVYCFAPVAGYSAFGSYTGNASANGPFIYTGFRPAFVLIKRCDTTSGGYWRILDDARNTSNVLDKELYPNAADSEGTFSALDFVSNGVKIRNSDSQFNAAATYFYACFAENPFKYSLARQDSICTP